MPIYVYRNLNTGETFEIKQSMKDSALKKDPKTGDPVKRLIQPVGIAFKGSGFYVNDSRSSSNKTKKTSNGSSLKKESKSTDLVVQNKKSKTKKETKSSKQTNAA